MLRNSICPSFPGRLAMPTTALYSCIFIVSFALFIPSSYAAEIPLKKQGGVYRVPVKINGVITLDFVLDSGASEVNIPADVFLTLMPGRDNKPQ